VPTITAFVAAFDAKVFNCTELLKSYLAGGNRIVKGPVKGKLPYVVVIEFSRFPFAFPCRDVSAKTAIQCLTQLFCLFGMPGYVHSDRGSARLCHRNCENFCYHALCLQAVQRRITLRGTQSERLNSTLWKTVKLNGKDVTNNSTQKIFAMHLSTNLEENFTSNPENPNEEFNNFF